MMGMLMQDLRYGFRMLWKSPAFTIVAVVALTLGIGANSAIFSVVNAVLLRPLPYENPEQLITPWGSRGAGSQRRAIVSYPDYADWRDETQTLSHLTAYSGSGVLLRGDGGEPEPLSGVNASANLFSLLPVTLAQGRGFNSEEDQAGATPVIVLGHGVWRRRFNSDPQLVGRQITIGTTSMTVLGVLPEGFKFPVDASRTDFIRPLAQAIGERTKRRGSYSFRTLARLKPGVTIAQAEAEMKATGQRLEQQYPDEGLRLGLSLVPLHEDLVAGIRPSLLVLLGAVGFVLLIACANVANLLLARAAGRQKEIAIRTAMGASRVRVIRQLLTESLLLSLVGGTLGLLLALWGVDLLVAASPVDIPRLKEVGLDTSVLVFTISVSVLTGIIFGLAPAWQATKIDLNEALKEGSRGSTEGLRHNRLRSLLVVSEVALSLVLLISAGLLIKSFLRLREVNPGFDAENVLTTSLSLSRTKYAKPEQQQLFFQEVSRRIKDVHGVEAVGLVDPLPLSGSFSANTFFIEGRPPAAPEDKPSSNFRHVSPDYFRAMNIPLLRGRIFNERDTSTTPHVIIVNETFARQFFAGEDALGKRITIEVDPAIDPNPPAREIVGIVGDVRHEALDKEGGAEYYISYLQDAVPFMELVVRAAPGQTEGVAPGVRNAVKGLDADQYVPRIDTMNSLLAVSIARRRFNMTLIGIFAAVALVLASVGIYGVMNYSVTRRTHEIGIRLALGAQSADVIRLIVGQGMILTLTGVGLGLTGAFAITRIMASLLFGVSPTDVVIFTAVSLLLAGVALLACLIPARRATRVDPMVALHYE
jgi:predicted permease